MLALSVLEGDIAEQAVDVIVNAANTSLLGGGGVDGAIHRRAGPGLMAACHALRGCVAGDAVVTPGYDAPAKHVVHTVGPVWRGGTAGEPAVLASCYTRSMVVSAALGAKIVAFPCIATGVYGYPLAPSAAIAVAAVKNAPAPGIESVRFVCFDAKAAAVYSRLTC